MEDFHYIDIHSHLNDSRFDSDLPLVLTRMRDARVATIVVGTDRAMSLRAVSITEGNSDIWATIGIHPTDERNDLFDETFYRSLAEHPRVVAIGECGLDYFRLDEFTGNKDAEVDRQQELFIAQMQLAASVDKPLMIHGRPEKGTMDAYEDILHILEEGKKRHGDKLRGNVHFFVGNVDIAKRFLDLDFTMSFTGVLTFTDEYNDVVRSLPLSSIMCETDAPYVSPIPYRGKRNEPAYVVEVVRAIARIKGESEATVTEAMMANAGRVFGINGKVE